MLTICVKRGLFSLAPVLAALMLLLLPGSAGVVAAPTGQVPTPQPTRPILLTDPVPDPHQPSVQWFAPTGHTLRGAFLDYWTIYGGLAQFGYPLTEEFVEPSGVSNPPTLTVQYFERNRFEYHPENAGTPYEVLLGLLGREFHTPDPPASPLRSATRYFESTGHNLRGAFLLYWDTHGGLFVHGYPITEQLEEVSPIDHKSYTVQYFERSRFEYHPENVGSPYEVLLGLLGTQLSQKRGYPYGWYPYGHAADFSWISGRNYDDPRSCPTCNCSTFQYVPNPSFLGRGISVHPYGPAWEVIEIARHQYDFLVIFGHITGSEIEPGNCFVPRYLVERVQPNPAP